jgi:PST family polysaccharide transporter
MTQKEPSQESLGKVAARSMRWIVIDKWGTRVASLLTLVVLGRLLVPADFGLVALASMFVSFANIFVDQGFGKALIQRRELRPEHIDTAFWAAVAVAVVLTVVTVLAAPLIARSVALPELSPVLRWMAVGLLFNALSGTPAALLERSFKFKSLAIRRLASTVTGCIAGVAVAFKGGGVWSLVVQSLVGAVVGLLMLWAATEWRPGRGFHVTALHELWPVGFGVLGIELLGFFGGQADRLLVGAFLGAQALGWYFMAMRIVTIMVEIFSSIFSTVSLTMFSRLQDDRDRLREWLYRLTGASSAVTIPCFALAAVLAPVLLPFILGSQWTASVVLFQVLSFLGAINAVASFDRSVLLATGRAKDAFLLTFGQSVLGIVLIAVAVPYGVFAVAIAVVARQYCYWPVRLVVLRRAIGIRPWTYLAQWLRPFAASLVMFAVIYGTVWLWPVLMSSPLLYLPGAALIGGVVYLAVLRAIDPRVFLDARLAFDSLRGPKS